LFNLAGERLDLPSVKVEGTSHRVINLGQYAMAGTAFEQGSLQVVYRGMELQMGAQVKLVDTKHGVIFDEQLVEPATMFASSRLEGVWWLPSEPCDVRLVVSNTTGLRHTVSVKMEGAAPAAGEALELTLGPHQTRVLEVGRAIAGPGGALNKMGGVSVRHTGGPGAVIARGMIGDAARGYSAVVELTDPQNAKTTKLHGAGLRLGRVADEELTPIVVARNTGTTPTVVTGRVPYTTNLDGQWTLDLPALRLGPGETKLVDTAALVRRSRTRPYIASAGVEFEYTGAAGQVVMAALSVSQSGRQVYRVPLLNPAALPSATGGYPWSIEGDSATVVYIKNVTDRPQQYSLQLTFAGGVYAPGLQTVETGQTVALDVRALRDHQVPDAEGRTIPPKVPRGQVSWSVVGADRLGLIGRAEQADVVGGLSSSYACVNCCPDSFNGGWCDPPSVSGYPTETTQFTAFQQNRDCFGNLLAPFSIYATWTSLNPSVATVDSGSGFTTAQAAGSTTIRASWNPLVWYPYLNNTCHSSLVNMVAEALCDVLKPKIFMTVPQFNPNEIARQSACSTLTVNLSASTGVPTGTQVAVEVFENENLKSVQLTVDMNTKSTPIVAAQSAQVTFQVCTTGSNNNSGEVTYRARILAINKDDVDRSPVDGQVSQQLKVSN
jgi:hypothetical protein